MEAAAVTLFEFEADGTRKPSIEVRSASGEAPIASVLAGDASYHPRIRKRWLDLAEHAAEPNCFMELWFMDASLGHLQVPDDLKLITVFGGPQGGVLLGVLPLHVVRGYARLPVRHVVNWMHFHSFLGTPLVRKGSEQQFWSAVLRLLDSSDWAKGFLHVTDLVEDGPVHRGLVAAARGLRRRCSTVYRSERAMLESELGPEAYYADVVRKKKRKELKRLSARLAELGKLEFRRLEGSQEVQPWVDDFLRLERSGWKGQQGSALACHAGTEAFFRGAAAGAFENGRLEMLRLDLDGRCIAMLVNLLTPPGSFSFKIAVNEEFARYSPGVLLQIENYRILDRIDIGWMDSCAAPDHPMINSLWRERRKLVRVTIPLSGPSRRLIHAFCRILEGASALKRKLRRTPAAKQEVHEDE